MEGEDVDVPGFDQWLFALLAFVARKRRAVKAEPLSEPSISSSGWMP
ncbi:MAG: hypothetical protein WKF41_09220 [Gaiellaceae bacterium]